ncbi:MAG: hypothetical protein HZC41_07445 [Chloroflexi bacterium]|nr:hypothetical protein [Chloroflexota bacterium]
MRVELDLRNLPSAAIMAYLVEAGGTVTGEWSAAGAGWSAQLLPLPPARIGVITVPRDLLVIEGDDRAVEQVHIFLRRKTMRGGG